MGTVFVTGSAGPIGSECVRYFAGLGWTVRGMGMPAQALTKEVPGYLHFYADIRDREMVIKLLAKTRPDLIIHADSRLPGKTTAQPCDDFEANTVGTLNVLEGLREAAWDAAMCFLSSSAVYGDTVSGLPLVELETRWEFEDEADLDGIRESMRLDQCQHGPYGVSKLAADILVQEYGRYYGLKTVCFRLSEDRQPQRLANLVRSCRESKPYPFVISHGGKQVLDYLHPVDVARACEAFCYAPRPGEVYNLGGGRDNSASALELIDAVEGALGKEISRECLDAAAVGLPVCYYADTGKFRKHYPDWSVTRPLRSIIEELCRTP